MKMTEKSLGIKENLTDLHFVALFLDTGQLLKTETKYGFLCCQHTFYGVRAELYSSSTW